MNRRAVLTLALAAASAGLLGHSPYRQWDVYRKKRLILLTNGADGTAVRLADQVVRVLALRFPESKALLATAASALDVAKLLRSEQLEVALLPADDAFGAFTGAADYGGWPVPLATLAVVEPALLHLVVRRAGAVREVPDLAGKAVGLGPPGGRTDAMLSRVLEAYGLDPRRAVRRAPMSPAEAATALKEKGIDAFAWADTLPSEAVRTLAVDPALGVRLIDHGAALAKIEAAYGRIYERATIAGGSYPGLMAPVAVAAVPHLVICLAALPDGAAHDIAGALGHGPLDASPLPVHPGAVPEPAPSPER